MVVWCGEPWKQSPDGHDSFRSLSDPLVAFCWAGFIADVVCFVVAALLIFALVIVLGGLFHFFSLHSPRVYLEAFDFLVVWVQESGQTEQHSHHPGSDPGH